jgi:hypothetical protein
LHRLIISFYRALTTNYPEYPWKIWKFKFPPDGLGSMYFPNLFSGFFGEKKNQRIIFDEIYKILNLKSWEDWYRINPLVIQEKGGDKVLPYYHYSYPNAVMNSKNYFLSSKIAAYPEFPWNIWKFENYMQNHKDFFDKLAKKMNITSLEGWYSIKQKDFLQNGGAHVLLAFNDSIYDALKNVYPGLRLPYHNIKNLL